MPNVQNRVKYCRKV